MAENKNIIKVAERIKALENIERKDLANAEVAVGIVRTAHEIQQQTKALADANEALKKKVKGLLGDKPATFYDTENETKVAVTYRGVNETTVDAAEFLAALTESVGAEKANAIFIDLLKKPVLDPDKVKALITVNHDAEKAAALAAHPSKVVAYFKPSAMSAAEKKAAEVGGIQDGIVIG